METFSYIEPMKAKLSDVEFLERVNNDHRWGAGEKFDGYRELLYLGAERNEMFSSLGTSHIDKVPQFKQLVKELAGTVIDCEGLSPTRRLEDNASCFKSDPPNAIDWQRRNGNATLAVFDVLRYKGLDVTKEQFGSRRTTLMWIATILQKCDFPIRLEELVFENKLAYYKKIVARSAAEGHEGIILKDMFAPYTPGKRGNAWLKVKRRERLKYHITGFLPGCGKFDGMVGAVIYGAFGHDDFYDIGSASGMDDAVRQDMMDHPDKYLHQEAWFECQEITSNGVMRHPRYKGLVKEVK